MFVCSSYSFATQPQRHYSQDILNALVAYATAVDARAIAASGAVLARFVDEHIDEEVEAARNDVYPLVKRVLLHLKSRDLRLDVRSYLECREVQ